MSENAVDRLRQEFNDLRRFLQDKDGENLILVIEENFPKALLIAAASHLERRLTEAVRDFAKEITTEDHPLVSLIEAKAIARQYHTWFNWRDAGNANAFFRLFGAAFEEYARDAVRRCDVLSDSIGAFLEIGRDRNLLVHRDFANFQLEKTSEDIYSLYLSSTIFVDWFPEAIREFSRNGGPAGAVTSV